MTKTLLEETRLIQKRLGSTPFPDDLQGTADDANVIIARQAFLVAQLKGDLVEARAEGRREGLEDALDIAKTHEKASRCMSCCGIGDVVDAIEQHLDA